MFTVGKLSRLARVSKRLLRYAVVAIVGIAVIFTLWLLARDDGFSVANDRQIMPGVRLNVQTAATSRGLVEYDMYGTQGPVVLSIHGGFGGADQGRLFASWLQDDGFRILSPSRPGYLGTPLESGKTYDEQADLLAALLDYLKVEKVGLLSYSAGSPVAYTFAARYPDRVWGLVSVAGVSRYEARGSSGSAMQAAFLNSVGNRLVRLFADVAPRTFLEGTLDETSYFTAERKEQRTAYIMDTPEKRAFFEALLNTTFPYNQRTAGNDNDIEQTPTVQALAFEKIKTPTLIVHGTQDADVPFYHGVYAYEHIPGAQRYWMEQEDHLGFWLSPDAGKAHNIVLDFLVRHAPVTHMDSPPLHLYIHPLTVSSRSPLLYTAINLIMYEISRRVSMSELEQSWIEQLNRRARRYQDAGMDSYAAVAQAAADFKLSVLVEGDVCRIYEVPDGILVNCWINGNSSNQAKDRPGFDNSIQWYTKKKTDGKE